MPRQNLRGPSRLDRRQLLRIGGALVALPLAGCGGSDDDLVIDTTSGSFRGQSNGGVSRWLGVPYAQPPVGALRLRSPQPVTPTAGIVDATASGAASLQTLPPYVTWIYPMPDLLSEDCLTLNVWTPSQTGRAPVVVWLHGGAWRTGATRMPLMDGERLAQQGVVVVSVNFRLGAMGCLAHPLLADPGTGATANWQLQDQLAALQWVHRNAPAFGGDPSRICLMGQSAGGTSAALLAQHPDARPLLQRVVLLSPAPHAAPQGFTLADAAAYTELVAARLGTDVPGLRSVAAADLHAAELAQNAAPLPPGFSSGLRIKAAPVVDGSLCRGDWLSAPWPADLPVMITNTLTEGSFFLDAIDPATQTRLTAPLPQSGTELNALVSGLVGATAAPGVITAYTQAAVAEGRSTAAGDLWVEIYGDRASRQAAVAYADTIAAAGADVRYGTHGHSIKSPGKGVPHCAELPFLFGTYGQDYYRLKVGAGAAEVQLSTDLSSTLGSFVRGDTVVALGAVMWPRYAGRATPTAALIGLGDRAAATIGVVPKVQQLAAWA